MQKSHSRSLATKGKSDMAMVKGVEKVKILGMCAREAGAQNHMETREWVEKWPQEPGLP